MSVPAELRERKQWVGALMTKKEGGKSEKQPINPHTGGLAKVNDPATWGAWEQARAWRDRQPARQGVRPGIGFVFTADDPFVGVDLDHCYDERGNLLPWAEPILRQLNSYTELSVSRTGIHIIAQGQLPDGGRRKGQIEMYDRSRFFVFTGDHVAPYPQEVCARTAELAALHREVFGEVAAQVTHVPPERDAPAASALPDDAELVRRACAAGNGDKFRRLWDGCWHSQYPSQSEADLALCALLAFWTGGDGPRIDRLFRQSGLMRPKWDVRHFADGATYGQDRIRTALASARDRYGENKALPIKDMDAPEEPAWLADYPLAWEAQAEPEPASEPAVAEAPATAGIIAAEMPEDDCPPLPEWAQVAEALGRDACPWLDQHAAYSRSWAPVAYEDFHEAAGLFLLSTVGGRRAVVHLNGPHYGNLSIAFVARSSLFRKTTTVKIAREVLAAAGLLFLLAPSDSTPEAFIKKCAEKGPGDWSTLSGAKLAEAELRAAFASQKGWIHNEFGGKLDKIAQDTGPMAGFSPLLRELDDCPPIYEYSTTGRGDALVEQPFLSLLASMTPADLEKHASRKSALWGNGFWARMAIICPPVDLRPLTAESREGERVPPPELVKGLADWHAWLGVPVVEREERERADRSKWCEVTVVRPPARAYALGEGVRAAHDRYARALEQLAFDLNLEALDGGYTRLAEKALRISLLLASMSRSERIELRHWARAQAITERWRRGLHHLFEAVNGGVVSTIEQARVQAEERILRELRKKGAAGASASQVRVATGLSLETCIDALKMMNQAGVVKLVRANQKNKAVYAVIA